MRVVGVTGTNGKTTTTALFGEIARAAGERVDVIGTLTAERTTPEAPELQASLAEMRERGVETVAMEVSSHALAQHRVDGTRFAAVGFTNLSRDHLDYHVDLDGYFEAKARLFTPEFTDSAAVNVDDDHGVELATRARAAGLNVRTYALDRDADLRIEGIATDRTGSSATLVAAEGRVPIRVPLVGRFNLANAAAAASIALERRAPVRSDRPGAGRGLARLRTHGADRRRPALHRAGRLRTHPARPRAGAARGA